MNVMMNSTMNSVVFTLTSPNMPEKMSPSRAVSETFEPGSVGFGISADTAIKKAITDPDEADQETFEFTPGKKVTYTLTLSNNGPGVATGVTVSDKLPAGVKFVKAEGDGTYDATAGVWNLSGETIAKGDDQSIEITVEITGDGAGALVTNVARISHQDQAGDDPTNNESSASFKGGYNLGGTIYRDSDASYSKSDSEQRFKGVTVALLNEDGTRCSTPTVSPWPRRPTRMVPISSWAWVEARTAW